MLSDMLFSVRLYQFLGAYRSFKVFFLSFYFFPFHTPLAAVCIHFSDLTCLFIVSNKCMIISADQIVWYLYKPFSSIYLPLIMVSSQYPTTYHDATIIHHGIYVFTMAYHEFNTATIVYHGLLWYVR